MKVAVMPVGQGDEPSSQRLYASTREEEMASWGWDEAQRAAFLQMEYQAQRLTYPQAYPNAEHALIIYQGEPVGRILINREPAEPLFAPADLPDGA